MTLTAKEQPRIGARWISVHGMSRSVEYQAWVDMKDRCARPDKYPNHAGKGIKVCDEWLNSFELFFAYLGLRPSSRHSLDRYPNGKGNYEPNNVRWATIEEQNSNTCHNVYLEHDSKRLTIAQWTRELGWKRGRLQSKLARGLSMAEAIAEQPKRRGTCMLCGKPMNAKGLCGAHYMQWRAGRLSVPNAI